MIYACRRCNCKWWIVIITTALLKRKRLFDCDIEYSKTNKNQMIKDENCEFVLGQKYSEITEITPVLKWHEFDIS